MSQTGDDDILVAAIAAGKTSAEAATLAGISRATVTRRRADPNFQARVDACRRGTSDSNYAQFLDSCTDVIKAFRGIVNDGNARAGDRIKAGRAIVELMLQLQTQVEIVDRLKAVESKLESVPVSDSAAAQETGSEGPAGEADGDGAEPDDLDD